MKVDTPSTARQQFLKELRDSCEDELSYYVKKANPSITPKRRDLQEQFGRENFRGKGAVMFNKLVEKLDVYKTENPKSTTSHPVYKGDGAPLTVIIITRL